MMLDYLSTALSLLSNLAAVYFYKLICDAFFVAKKRKDVSIIYFAFFLSAYFISNLVQAFFGYGIKIIAETLIIYMYCYLLYESRWDRRFFIVVTQYTLVFTFNIWAENVVRWLIDLSYEQFVWDIPLYSTFYVGRCILNVALALLIRKFHRPRRQNAKFRVWIPACTIFPVITLGIMWRVLSVNEQKDVWLICLSILVFVDVVALLFLDRLEQSSIEHEELLASMERTRIQDESLKAISQAYSVQRKMTHDFNTHLQTLFELLSQKKYAEAEKYLLQLQERRCGRVLLVNSHHATLDAILNQKGYAGQQQSIDMRFQVNDLSAVHIPVTDIAVVLGNLLDNAIEACMKFPKQERWVFCKVLNCEDTKTLFLSVVNPSKPVVIENDQLISDKQDQTLHGFGLKNVRETLERCGAEYDYEYKSDQFIFSIEWPETVTK